MSYKSPQSKRNLEPNNRQLLIVLSIFTTIIVLIISVLGWAINALIDFIPLSVEQKIGALIVPVYEQQSLDSPAQNTLNNLLDRLEQNLPPEQKKDRDYRVLYIANSTINAVAIPGDRIIIYQGLLQQTEWENELMMILGHELGHFAHRDHLRGLGKSLIIRSAIAYLIGNSSMLESALGNMVNSIANAQYSQSQEREADKFGLVLLNKTYGHVAGATDFFLRMSKKQNLDIGFLSTHPAPGDRVKTIESLIKQAHYSIKERSPLPLELVKVKSSSKARANADILATMIARKTQI
jgi:predicted Zn-dependent protease